MDLGELRIALELDNDISRGLAGVKRELQEIPPVARREMVAVSRVMRDEGENGGGLLAQGIRSGVQRNSPLIVAAVGGVLAAGAPAAILGATALFGGIAGVAGSQSLVVREAWTSLGDEIRDGVVSDAASTIPALVGMADDLGASFQRLRPQLREAFEATNPLVEEFTGGLTDAAENAMPGLLEAVQAGGPVMEGFRDFLGDVGTGVGEFFSTISEQGPAAGQVMSSLGDATAELLPTLATLIGRGAELASVVLPPFASALGVVNDVTRALGPALPALAAGFIGLKTAQAATGWVGGLGEKISGLKAQLAGTSTLTLGLGSAVAIAATAFVDSEAQTARWTAALNEGGRAAADARREMTEFAAVNDQLTTGVGGFLANFNPVGPAFRMYGDDVGEAEAANRDYLASLSPVEEAARAAAEAEDNLNRVMNDSSSTTADVSAAKRDFEAASRAVADAEGATETSIRGVTVAMVEQAAQAMAAIDSGFALVNARRQQSDAEARLTELMNSGTASANDMQAAQERITESTYRTAAAFGRQQADLSGAEEGSSEYAHTLQTQTLRELERLQQSAGPATARALQQQIDMLRATGGNLDDVARRANNAAGAAANLGRQRPTVVAGLQDNATARIQAIAASLATLRDRDIFVTTYYQSRGNATLGQASGRYVAADGGNAGDVAGFSEGGRLSGPGGPRDDMIPAIVNGLRPIAVSDDEWIINAAASGRYGDRRMAAINAGRAVVLLPEDMQGFAGGGRAGGGGMDMDALAAAVARAMPPSVHVEHLHQTDGGPRDIARELAYEARTGRR